MWKNFHCLPLSNGEFSGHDSKVHVRRHPLSLSLSLHLSIHLSVYLLISLSCLMIYCPTAAHCSLNVCLQVPWPLHGAAKEVFPSELLEERWFMYRSSLFWRCDGRRKQGIISSTVWASAAQWESQGSLALPWWRSCHLSYVMCSTVCSKIAEKDHRVQPPKCCKYVPNRPIGIGWKDNRKCEEVHFKCSRFSKPQNNDCNHKWS